MEKGGFRRLGRLFHRKSESEDSEPDSRRTTPLSSPCPSPSLSQRREASRGSPPGEPKKRSAFGHWRLKKKRKDPPTAAAAAATPTEESRAPDSAPASPSLSFSSEFTASEPTTPTNRCFDMPDTQFAAHGYQLSLVPAQDSQFPFAISMDTITSSTLPASFRKEGLEPIPSRYRGPTVDPHGATWCSYFKTAEAIHFFKH